ncbi:general secretion pathway protein GspB [Shewanella fidelis]|uniref:General secretion pathway protein GspB n=1 Tax=Shewanella fidelis TaxID=173509 RepID=A0AAW8NSJ5_9GAMM|nr:general secretion pathway protein GspB [Shewanella fidelis]MDR8524839.1 general secretion pathway protein GspB [Shewanella fidelis]MDW4810910.1 general secretion pathway protein GspB [Shewanella fidelis]MDW4815311.1 general secretion pathway protein GspB [Shewanella fidelis]MDW4819401.1 general secretion pathway protein GspB [Shewanella fidelis]MDW4822921.1 general secretion pathway protein GspB [Shewanella fidelis]
MSILLDAVTRDKQQSQVNNHDVVLTPRAPYRAKQQRGYNIRSLMIYGLSLLLMVLAAWLLSLALYPSEKSTTSNKLEQIALSTPAKSVQNHEQNISPEPTTNEVRLAGKVALPMAQAYTPQVAVSHQSGTAASYNQFASSSNDELKNEELKNAVSAAEASVTHSENTAASARSSQPSNSFSESDNEPIMLGANSNKRGDELLESLKYQVENAANDVGLETTKPADNNLLAAFEAALKEVERENAVETPVTEAKLDPIPVTPKSDDIPKYGQLPAGLQLQVPEFNINAHVYSSVPDNRWLNVDGAELQEGDSIQGKLTIVEIRPRDVVLAIQGTEFKVPAI